MTAPYIDCIIRDREYIPDGNARIFHMLLEFRRFCPLTGVHVGFNFRCFYWKK